MAHKSLPDSSTQTFLHCQSSMNQILETETFCFANSTDVYYNSIISLQPGGEAHLIDYYMKVQLQDSAAPNV